MLQKDLQGIGLSNKEAKAYLATLELGETTISRIARKSGINRTTTYLAISELKEKGLISTIKKGGKSFFYAESPKKLEEKEKEKLVNLGEMMPELMSLANLIDKKPKIRYFEGLDGVREIYRDTLLYPSKEVLAWVPASYSGYDPNFFKYFEQYITKRLEKRILVRAIVRDSEMVRKYTNDDQKQLRVSKFSKSENFNLKIEIDIYGNDKVGILSFKDEMGVIIESKDIHDSLKSIFEMQWESLPDKNNNYQGEE